MEVHPPVSSVSQRYCWLCEWSKSALLGSLCFSCWWCSFPILVCLLIFPLTLRGLWEHCEMHLAHQSLEGSHPVSAAAFEWERGWLPEIKAITWTWQGKKERVFFCFPHQEAFYFAPTKHDVTLIAFPKPLDRTSFQIRVFLVLFYNAWFIFRCQVTSESLLLLQLAVYHNWICFWEKLNLCKQIHFTRMDCVQFWCFAFVSQVTIWYSLITKQVS